MTAPTLSGYTIFVLSMITWWLVALGNHFSKSEHELTAFIGKSIIFLSGGLGTITFLSLISIP
jgi:hypothetical protein